ncbi:Tautomerase/MIF superfamily [Amylocarpus encephaloides]|uniref:L-dopachrome isomerase n=1 Tax=Amylocarpus encephaloides TaxID=45428 RepID=A0A9P7YSX5_9HELO|nr:Tautomerase/MIF superfamily [Amylocarpus encephaloides]
MPSIDSSSGRSSFAVVDQRTEGFSSPGQFPPSPADSSMAMNRDRSPRSSHSAANEEQRITREIYRGAPGDRAIFDENKTPEQRQLARKKSQYYHDVFAYREPVSSARERISRESMIIAEIKTNVIIGDEYTFITEISYALSSRYQRPESSIMVIIAHSSCLVLGGSFDPAYLMDITALQSQLQPVTNKRNSTLIAKVMEESLGVPPGRGIIKFIPIAEENLATDSKTVAGEIDELERESMEDGSGIQRAASRVSGKTRRQSMKAIRKLKSSSHLPTHTEQMTPPDSARVTSMDAIPPLPPTPSTKSFDGKAAKAQRMGRRKSFIASIFGKS